MRPAFDIVVIGGGSAGLVVAAGGAALGARVALVERARLGGDCLWYGCVPSKTLIKSARIAYEMRNAGRWALSPADPAPQIAQVMERVRDVIMQIQPNDSPERFRSLGVDVIEGDGKFSSPRSFEVAGRTLTATSFVIATGSRPAIPAVPGLASVPYLTNETVFDLREPVPSLIVIGGGPVGCELAQAFRRLGSDVTVVDATPRLLPREDADVVQVVQAQLAAEGIDFRFGATVERVGGGPGNVECTIGRHDGGEEMLRATHLLVATGRKLNVEHLGLDAASVAVENGRIVADGGLRTSQRHIYVAGDVAGGAQFTHLAEHHAGIVLRHAIFGMRWARPSTVVPSCTYTDPEIARVGLSEGEAIAQGVAHTVHRFPFADIDRARAEGEVEGFGKLVTDRKGRILGAAIVGAHAGELVAEFTLAMSQGLSAKHVSATIHAYPTLASISRRVADQRMKEGLTPTARTWIKRIFRLRGGS